MNVQIVHFSIKKKPKEYFKVEAGRYLVAIYVQLAKTFHWAPRAPLLFFVCNVAPVVPTTSAQLSCVLLAGLNA